jgi:hypothetical protein
MQDNRETGRQATTYVAKNVISRQKSRDRIPATVPRHKTLADFEKKSRPLARLLEILNFNG